MQLSYRKMTTQKLQGSWCASPRFVVVPARTYTGQFHGLKEVKKAAKKAKAFETRKIVKLLKASGYAFFSASKTRGHVVSRASLREKRADKSVLEAELKALKVLYV